MVSFNGLHTTHPICHFSLGPSQLLHRHLGGGTCDEDSNPMLHNGRSKHLMDMRQRPGWLSNLWNPANPLA